METRDLARHLLATEERFDILKTFDRTGHTPLHFATYRNVEEAVNVLIEFVSSMTFRCFGNTRRTIRKTRKKIEKSC